MNREGNTFFLSTLQNYNFYIAMEKILKKKKKREKTQKSRIFRCHTIFTLREEHYLNNWGEGTRCGRIFQTQSNFFFFFVARVLKSKDILTIDEQYHLEITMGMVG